MGLLALASLSVGLALGNHLTAIFLVPLGLAYAGAVGWRTVSVRGWLVVVLAFLQPLHGLTFALLHLACMRIIASVVPIRLSATAQAFYAFGSGVVSAALTALSGTLYATYGGLSFFAMAVLCGVALPFAWYGLRDR